MPKFDGRSSNKLPKYLAKSEVKKILEVAEEEDAEHHLILLTMWRSGVRVAELVELKAEDINFKDDKIEVRGGKGDKDRMVPLHSELKSQLKSYIDYRDIKDTDILFDYSTRWIEMLVDRYTDKSDVDRNTFPHMFRHGYAVHCLKCGYNIRNLQKNLGHSSLQITARYLDLLDEERINQFKEKVE